MKREPFIDKFVSEHLFEEFYFFNVGSEICESGHRFGPNFREHYLIHYIAEGKGTFETQGVTYNLEAGDFFILRPDQIAYYEADEKEPWLYYWLGFAGVKAEDLLLVNGISASDNVGRVLESKIMAPLFKELLLMDLFDQSHYLIIQSLFYRLFANFRGNQKMVIATNNKGQNQRYSASFLMYIQKNYDRETLTITEIAKSMNLNSSYLTQVIKEELKVTPNDYLTNYRLSKARVLLSSSDLPVYDVAAKVGYKSSHTFSRAFKQKEKLTPSDYAKRHRK